jgi:cell division protein FtsW
MFYTTPNNNAASIMGTSPNDIDTPKQGSDRVLLTSVIILMVFGVLAIYSAIAYFAETKHTTAGSLVIGHLTKLFGAFILMLIVSKIDYHIIAKFSRLAMVLSWMLLIGVMIFGAEVFGAKRSINISGFSLQPSFLAAVSLLIHISVLLSKKQDYIKDFKKSFVPILFWVVITCGLIGIEDLSSAALLITLSLILMFVGRISTIQLGGLIAIGLLGGAILIWQSPERISRVENFLDRTVNLETTELKIGEGYQAQQAQIAIAQGQLTGVGIGKSTQRDFLPAPYNDFIFAIIAEEYGLIGSSAVILLFTIILFRGIVNIARKAPDTLGALMALGCTLMVVLYGFVNAGVASGLLPVTGLPMPFVSYGGSSIFTTGIMVGILMNISKHSKHSVFYA